MKTHSKRYVVASLVFASLMLSACSDLFVTDEDRPLPGTRISALQLQRDLAPSDALKGAAPQLPEAWANQLWPQSGGYPTHAMGHLALGKDLKRVWSASVGAGGGRRAPLTAGPVVAENTVFTLDAEGQVTAFDLAKGKSKWRVSVVPKGEDETAAVGGGLAYADGKLYVTAGYKALTALDPVSGKTVWNIAIPAPARAAPTVLDNKIYLTLIDNRLAVYDAAEGKDLWKYTGIAETTNLLGAAGSAAAPGLIVLPLSTGEISGLDPNDGRLLWQDNLSAIRRTGSLSTISDIRALPVIDGGAVYAVSYSGRMVALDQTTGDRLWQREIGSGETPLVAGDAVFVLTSEQQVVALSRANGDIYWVAPLPHIEDEETVVWAGPVLAGGRLLATGSNGELAEIDPQSGKILGKKDIGDGSLIAPVVSNNTLLVIDTDGDLSAYR